jgi:hypothetical protein
MTLTAIHIIQADITCRKTGYPHQTTLSNDYRSLASSTLIKPKWEGEVRIYPAKKKKELLIFRLNPLPHILGAFMVMVTKHLADKIISASALNIVSELR